MAKILIIHPLTNVSYVITTSAKEAKIAEGHTTFATVNFKSLDISWAANHGAEKKAQILIGALQIAQAIIQLVLGGDAIDGENLDAATVGICAD